MCRKSAMTDNEAFRLSMIVLRTTYELQTAPRAEQWSWFFRDFVQSHALIKVVSELCKGASSNVDPANASDAWLFIEEIVERIPPSRRRDPSVSPIITLMAHARRSRASSSATPSGAGQPHQTLQGYPAHITHESPTGYGHPVELIQKFTDTWAQNAVYWGDKFLRAAITTPNTTTGGDSAVSSPAVATIRSSGTPADSSIDGRLSMADLPLVDSTPKRINWNQWNDSLNIPNTERGP
jgi:hypothetical protein